MPFNPIKFLERYQIPYFTHGKNVSRDFVNICCIFCRDSSNHGGFSLKNGNYNCWICGKHSTVDVIANLLNITNKDAFKIYKQFSKVRGVETSFSNSFIESASPLTCSLPRFSVPLLNSHKKYLRSRNFDPDEIVRKWKIQGTNHLGHYMKRIIIPIYYNNKLVSFTSRDITEQSNLKYKACPKKEAVISHKEILYGIDHTKEKTIICEGPMDVWRLGYGAVCTFGTKVTKKQLKLIIDRFDKVYLMFDPDEAGEENQMKLGEYLEGFGVDCEIIDLEGKDPAELSEDEAKKYKELLK